MPTRWLGAHLMTGRKEEAIKLGRKAAEIAPDSLLAITMLGFALSGASAWEEAIESFSRAVDRFARTPYSLAMWSQAASGRHEQSRQTLGELERRGFGWLQIRACCPSP